MELTEYDKKVLTDRTMRQREDRLKGLSRSKGPERGDFNICGKLDKTLGDYRRFKNKGDRAKIVKEYYGLQREARRVE